jgi:hypothetical protein
VARSLPAIATEVPGNFITSALWASQVTATMQWMMGNATNGVPRFKGYAATTQPLASATTDTAINLDTEQWDSDGGHSTTTNPSRYTVQVAGQYHVVVVGSFPTNATGDRKLGVNVNGAAAMGSVTQQAAPSAHSWSGCVAVDLSLNVGDYVEMTMWQTSGVSLAPNASTSFGPCMSLTWYSTP